MSTDPSKAKATRDRLALSSQVERRRAGDAVNRRLSQPRYVSPGAALRERMLRSQPRPKLQVLADRISDLRSILALNPDRPNHRLRVALAETEREHLELAALYSGRRATSNRPKGGRPRVQPETCKARLLRAMQMHAEKEGENAAVTNAALARAGKCGEDRIADWLKRAGWTRDELEREWWRRRRLTTPPA